MHHIAQARGATRKSFRFRREQMWVDPACLEMEEKVYFKLWVKLECSPQQTQIVPKWHFAGQLARTDFFNTRARSSAAMPHPNGHKSTKSYRRYVISRVLCSYVPPVSSHRVWPSEKCFSCLSAAETGKQSVRLAAPKCCI